MPWTIPNLVLHDKPVLLADMRSQGRNRVFVCCCHHNAELNVRRLRDLQRRTVKVIRLVEAEVAAALMIFGNSGRHEVTFAWTKS